MHGFVPAMAMVHVHGHCFQTPPDTGDFNDGQSFGNNFSFLLGRALRGGVPHSPLAGSRGEVWTDKLASEPTNCLSVNFTGRQTDENNE